MIEKQRRRWKNKTSNSIAIVDFTPGTTDGHVRRKDMYCYRYLDMETNSRLMI